MATKSHAYTLERLERRTVLALGSEMVRLQQEAQEVNEALAELARRYAGERGWSEDEGMPHFEQRSGGDVVLLIEPAPKEAPDPGEPVSDESAPADPGEEDGGEETGKEEDSP